MQIALLGTEPSRVRAALRLEAVPPDLRGTVDGLALRSRRLLVGVVIGACACNGAEARTESAARSAGPGLSAPQSEGSPPDELSTLKELPASCLLAGVDAVEREDSFTSIVFEYYVQTDQCQTRGLVSAMSDTQMDDWLVYLLNYSHALFGCGLLFDPLPGGVGAFGLANTEAVGVASPMLGADDVALLMDIYLTGCAKELPMTSAELAELRRRLEAAALPRIDPSLTARLSDCP